MPIPNQTYRINPLDLQPNTAIGISLPFNSGGAFGVTYNTKDQVKHNLINYLLTNRGERIENPNFGSNLKKYLFEQIVDDNISLIKNTLTSELALYFPEIIVKSINFNTNPDNNSIYIQVSYIMRLSGTADLVTINFQ